MAADGGLIAARKLVSICYKNEVKLMIIDGDLLNLQK